MDPYVPRKFDSYPLVMSCVQGVMFLRHLAILQKKLNGAAEVCLESCQRSTMELFTKTVNGLKFFWGNS